MKSFSIADKKQAAGSPMPDYRFYHLSAKETVTAGAIYVGIASVLVFLFYDRLYLLIPLLPGIIPFLRFYASGKAGARRSKLTYEFRDALDSLAVSLKAGYSVENAFPAAARDLGAILGPDADMARELRYIALQSRLSVPIENLLLDFARRSGSEDIRNFAAVFAAAKRMGGNMPAIIRSAADSIGGKIDVSREIDASLAAKKMEQTIMTAMPCGILGYMRFSSPGFLDVLYRTAFGAVIMTACLAGYAVSVWWSHRIVSIHV